MIRLFAEELVFADDAFDLGAFRACEDDVASRFRTVDTCVSVLVCVTYDIIVFHQTLQRRTPSTLVEGAL
jgi:hypothetical protein